MEDNCFFHTVAFFLTSNISGIHSVPSAVHMIILIEDCHKIEALECAKLLFTKLCEFGQGYSLSSV